MNMNTSRQTYRTVLENYRIALGFLGSIRALYPAHSPVLAAAVQRVRDLELTLQQYQGAIGV